MQTGLYVYALIQLACYLPILLLPGFRNLPISLRLLTLSCYVTAPLAILAQSMASAVFLLDFTVPICFFYLLVKHGTGILGKQIWLVLLAFLLLLAYPAFMGIMNIILGNDIFAQDGVRSHLSWFVRSLNMFFVFALACKYALDDVQLRSFARFNIILCLVFGLMSIFAYFGPYNLNIYDLVEQVDAKIVDTQRIGGGEWGLFRGSMGQLFALVAILSIASLSVSWKNWKILGFLATTVCAANVLFSLSRAGLVGLLTGGISLFLVQKKSRIAIVSGLVLLGLSAYEISLNFEEVDRRISELSRAAVTGDTREEGVDSGRLAGWDRSIRLIATQPSVFFFGVAPGNSTLVSVRTGLYGGHNEYIDAVLRAGIGELALELFFVIAVTLRLWHIRRQIGLASRWVINGALSMVAANCVIAVTQSHVLNYTSTYLIGSLIFLLYGIVASTRVSEPEDLGGGKAPGILKPQPALKEIG